MKKIFKDFIICCCITLCVIGILSLYIPYSTVSNNTGLYEFNVTYVNGITKNIVYKLPNKFSYNIYSNRGSYGLIIESDAKTIWGYKSLNGFQECNIPGILTVNSIKQLK